MLLKKYRFLKKEKWTRKYIKIDMCSVCKHKDDDCVSSGKLKDCAKVNSDEELFDGRYNYAYVV